MSKGTTLQMPKFREILGQLGILRVFFVRFSYDFEQRLKYQSKGQCHFMNDRKGNKDSHFRKVLIKRKTKSEEGLIKGNSASRLSRLKETTEVDRRNKIVPIKTVFPW